MYCGVNIHNAACERRHDIMAADGHPGDVAAVWDIKLVDGIHKIVFEHGTSSGKRVITVDGVEVSSLF